MFLLFFRVRQELSEMGWDRFVDESVSGLFEGRTWAFAYPVQGHSQIQCRSESGARQRGHRALTSLARGSWV